MLAGFRDQGSGIRDQGSEDVTARLGGRGNVGDAWFYLLLRREAPHEFQIPGTVIARPAAIHAVVE
jgi:hypothetical protein